MLKKGELVRFTTQDISRAIPVTDSWIVAEKTKRKHKDVLELVSRYADHFKEFGRVTFETRPFDTAGGVQERKVVLFNEGQATFLITLMRNSNEVLQFKKDLVKAFVYMKHELSARKETRHISKVFRNSLTASIRNNIDNDGRFKQYAYSNYTKLVYKKVLGMTVKKFKKKHNIPIDDNIRDYLDVETLSYVQELESKIATIIEFSKNKDKKEVYQEVKNYIDIL